MTDTVRNIADECRRQEESCLYTSTALFEWVKFLRVWKVGFVITPIVLAGIATGFPAQLRPDYGWIAAICTMFAGITMAVYKALDFDVSLTQVSKQANQYKVLQDAFRQAWRIHASGDAGALAAHFKTLMERLDSLRLSSLPPPERFFKRAQAKVSSGDYDFSADSKSPSQSG